MASLSGSVSATQTSSASSLTTGSLTSNAGDLIVVAIGLPSATATVKAVSDSAGNTYVPRSRAPGSGISGEVWVAADVVASSSNTISVALYSALSGWGVAAGSYSGGTGLAAVGVPQIADTNGVNALVAAPIGGAVIVAITFSSPAVHFSSFPSSYADIPGSGASAFVHQSYLLSGAAGPNDFAGTLSSSQNLVCVLLVLGPNAWSALGLGGKPLLTVSPVGSAAGYPTNNGADYGPDTPGTSTGGVHEGASAAVSAGVPLFAVGDFGTSGSPVQIDLSSFSNLEFYLPGTLTGQLIIGGSRNHVYIRKLVGAPLGTWPQTCIVEQGSTYSRIEVLELAGPSSTVDCYQADLDTATIGSTLQTEYRFGHIGGGRYSIYVFCALNSTTTTQWSGNWLSVGLIDSPYLEGIKLQDRSEDGGLITYNSFLADLDGGSGSNTEYGLDIQAVFNLFWIPFLGNFNSGQITETLTNAAIQGVSPPPYLPLANLYIMAEPLFAYAKQTVSTESRVIQPPNYDLGFARQPDFAQPSFPKSGVGQTNLFPFYVRIYITSLGTSTITEVTLTDYLGNTSSVGPASVGSSWELDPGESITFTYTGSTAPTWSWYYAP